jgi:alpha-tubulin suppressor-like RCC1 family protein
VRGAGGDFWDLVFAAPAGGRIEPGRYLRTLHPAQAGSGPALEIKSGTGSCETGGGHFDVARADYESDGKLQRFDVTFTYFCGNAGVRGALRLGLDPAPAAPTLPPSPKGSASFTRRPNGGPAYTWSFSSDNGDNFGAGFGTVAGDSVAAAVVPSEMPSWLFFFGNSPGERLVPGDYLQAVSLVSPAPGRPSILELDMGGSGYCAEITGNFRILKAVYAASDDSAQEQLTDFHAIWESKCGNVYSTRGDFRFQMPPAPPQHSTATTWGWNGFGELGNGRTDGVSDPSTLGSLRGVRQISAGWVHSLALKEDGTVWAWGYNGFGQLGDGTRTDRSAPVQVKELENIKHVSAGVFHSIAVDAAGTVYTWGYNGFGQLGQYSYTDSLLPRNVVHLAKGISKVSAGYLHSLALGDDGSVWAWGYNGFGQLGHGNRVDRVEPVRVPGAFGATDISAGWFHSLAVKDGRAWGWGWNAFGQLGTGNTIDRLSPAAALKITSATKVSAGFAHSLAVDAQGSAHGWGWNGYGQLGDGTNKDSSVPLGIIVANSPFTDVSAGMFHSAGAAGSRGWAWGSNIVGQLGDGSTTDRLTPVKVPGTLGVTSVGAGGYHSMLSGFAKS